MVTKTMLKNALIDLGVEKGMVLEVHSSLSSFGELYKDTLRHKFWGRTSDTFLSYVMWAEGSKI